MNEQSFFSIARVSRCAAPALLCVACNHCAPGRPAQQRVGGRGAAPDASIAAAPTLDASAEEVLPPLMQDGCWSGLTPSGSADALLGALAARCAQGMQPVFSKPRFVRLGDGRSHGFSFRVEQADLCLRAAAVSTDPVSRLDLKLFDPGQREIARDAHHRWFSLVGPDGPVCVGVAGRYRVVVDQQSGKGPVAVQVWQAR